MNKTSLIPIIIVLVVISAGYTLWQFLHQRNTEREKYKNYIAARAVINEQLPARVTRYGAKPARYRITIEGKDGAKLVRSNCELGGDYHPNDTLTIYYNPANPEDEVVTSLK